MLVRFVFFVASWNVMAYKFLTTERDGRGRVPDAEPPRRAQRLQRTRDRRADGVGGASACGDRATCASSCSPAPGKTFCAAPTSTWMAKHGPLHRSRRTCAMRSRPSRDVRARSTELPVPLIGRVQGAALGGGAGLAAVCDIVVAEDRGGVRLHRGEAGHSAGRHLAVRAREDRARRRRASCS